jgi:beta-phosphoglucomutase family hydrolase
MQNPEMFIDNPDVWRFCFACGDENPIGLKLRFSYDGDQVEAKFTPSKYHQGWGDIIHGGILYTLLDEATAYAVLCHGIGSCVTAKSQIRFIHTARIDEPIYITARVTKTTSRLVETTGKLSLKDNTAVAEISSLFYVHGNTNRAVLWDMDGVIADSARFHFAAWQEIFDSRGVKFSQADFTRLFGTRQDFIIRNILGEKLSQHDVDELSQQKESIYRDKFRGNVRAFPGAMKLLHILKDSNFKLALVTSAPRENIELICNELKLEGIFNTVVSGRDVTESKPSAQIYLLAAGRLGVKPEDCVVVEDSPFGIQGAKSAGMKCLAVATTHTRQELEAADRVVNSLEEIDLIGLLFKLSS